MALDHLLTHSILINLFIKVRLNTLLLPPLLSIAFFPSAFYVYVWNILEGTSKTNFLFQMLYLIWRRCDVKELLQPDDGISFSEKRISQRAL